MDHLILQARLGQEMIQFATCLRQADNLPSPEQRRRGLSRVPSGSCVWLARPRNQQAQTVQEEDSDYSNQFEFDGEIFLRF